jgi:hypothetical protein
MRILSTLSLCLLLASCQADDQDIHCLCVYPEAALKVTGAPGQPLKNVRIESSSASGHCNEAKAGVNCNIDGPDGPHSLTIHADGYQSQSGTFGITSGTADTVCRCAWKTIDPAELELKKLP